MKSKMLNMTKSVTTNVLILASLCCVLPMLSMAQAQPATTTATIGPKGFDTPQQAAAAIIKAAGDYNVPELCVLARTVRRLHRDQSQDNSGTL